MNKKIILKVLIGSRAHGLENKDSDYDYRLVYIVPTSEILSLNYKYKGTTWIEGDKEDNTAYEISHFLQLATKNNPTILDVFKAPIIEITEEGEELRNLFPFVWNSTGVLNAWIGYGLNQRKKFLDNKDNRANKYATAYIRTIFNLCELLSKKHWTVKVGNLPIGKTLRKIKNGKYNKGEIINLAEKYIEQANKIYNSKEKHEQKIEEVNKYLLKIRKKYWS